MTHVALARKYRPQAFSDLIGQEAIVKTLQQAISGNRIHHAYIFTGTRGVGKTTTARIFAKALNCAGGPRIEPCNACPSCMEITEGASVDVFEIDAASHTKVEETRELLGRVAYAPAGGKYRVFIIDEAHMLSKSSFNALLKTLEEPPSHAVFILATTEPQKILETVRSRCIEFVFRRIVPANIALNLRRVLDIEGIAYQPEAIDRLAIEADGSMRDALSLTDQVIGYAAGNLSRESVESALGLTSKDVVASLWQAILARSPAEVHRVLGDAYRNGADLRRLGIDMADYLRQIIVLRATGGEGEGLVAQVLGASQDWQPTDLHRMFDRLHVALLDIERSPIPDIVLETALLRLAVLEPLGKLEDLLTGQAGPAAVPQPVQNPAGSRDAAPRSTRAASGASAATVREAPESSGAVSAPTPTASGRGAEIVAALAEHLPMLASILQEYATWDGGTLRVSLPPTQIVYRSLLEQDSARILSALAACGCPNAALVVVEQPTAVATQVATTPSAGGKRALLDDERLAALLKAFPGAEVVDIRRVQ